MEKLTMINCKNCGAPLDMQSTNGGGGVLECAFCHSRFTVARSENEKAREFVREGEILLGLNKFDEAYDAFNKATEYDKAEAQAYFGMALAEFKVQYLNDCINNRLQPVCHDISDKIFSQCGNYKKALSCGSPEQCKEFERNAAEIEYIHREFFKLKSKGLDYDCFICVKVTGEDGSKTRDSNIANDLYYYLKDRGYRPFYSERDIQNETGADYEARILYALHASESMIIVCGNEAYLQTPWVRNEYTRFLSLIGDERKASDSIAIAFSGAPIERLPGKKGTLQGVCLDKPDAFGKLVEFVEQHRLDVAEALKLARKTYGKVEYAKKTVIESRIVKRELGTYTKTALTISEQAKLDIARDMLASGNYDAAISRCDAIIATNKSCSDAYWYKFLAENRCANSKAFSKSTTHVSSFDNLEKAIATGDKSQRAAYYDALYKRVSNEKSAYLFEEYIALPESDEHNIQLLVDLLYKKAMNSEDEKEGATNTENKHIVNAVIKTVSDVDKYVEMNVSFADKVFITDTLGALVYYKNALEADATQPQALWRVFVIENGLCTLNDMDGIADNIDGHKLANLLSDKSGRDKIESTVFAYGFNDAAFASLFENCMISRDGENNIKTRIDFLLSLIPSNDDALYTKYLRKAVNMAIIERQFDIARIYNDMLIGLNKFDHLAYFDRLYIKNGIVNPFALVPSVDAILDDPDFSAAIDAFAESNSKTKNIYIEFVKTLKNVATLLGSDTVEFLVKCYDLTEEGLLLGAQVFKGWDCFGFVEKITQREKLGLHALVNDSDLDLNHFKSNKEYSILKKQTKRKQAQKEKALKFFKHFSVIAPIIFAVCTYAGCGSGIVFILIPAAIITFVASIVIGIIEIVIRRKTSDKVLSDEHFKAVLIICGICIGCAVIAVSAGSILFCR